MFVTKLLLYELLFLSQCGGWEVGNVWGMLNVKGSVSMVSFKEEYLKGVP